MTWTKFLSLGKRWRGYRVDPRSTSGLEIGESNTEAVYRKGHSRLSFLRKLSSFNACSKMLNFFWYVVASVLYSHLLGQQHQRQGHQKTEQSDKEGRLCAGDFTGGGGEGNAAQTAHHNGEY